MRRWGLAIAAVLLAAAAHAATGDDSDPINPLPAVSPDANSYARSRAFMQNEDADRFEAQFYPFTDSGCLHPVPGSGYVGTFSTTPCVAYPGGFRISDATASVNYSSAGAGSTDTCWLAVTAASSGSSGNFYRFPSSHYMADCVNTTQPAAPTDGIMLLKVVIASGSITTVTDLRRLSPVVYSLTRSLFSTTVIPAGDFYFATNTLCLYIGNGTTPGGVLIGCNQTAGADGDVYCPVGGGTENMVPSYSATDCTLKDTCVSAYSNGLLEAGIVDLKDPCNDNPGFMRIYEADDPSNESWTLQSGGPMAADCALLMPTACCAVGDVIEFTADGTQCAPNASSGSGCDIHVTVTEFAEDGALLFWTKFARDCSYPADLAGSRVEAWGNGAFAEAVINISKVDAADCNPVDYNATLVYTATFPADTSIGTAVLDGTATDFDIDDCIYIEAPSPADGSLGPYGIWIKGTPQ